MGKLTPTFKETKAEKNGNGVAMPQAIPLDNPGVPPALAMFNEVKPRIEPAHEPLKNELPPPVLLQPFKLEDPKPWVPPVAPAAEPAPLKIALVGTAPASRMLAPFNDPSWTIWACSPGNMNMLPKVDAWFELHGNLHWPENQSYGGPYIEWLRKLTIPVYMQNRNYLANAEIFPVGQMVDQFGPDFFTSSFAWMMAFAISKGAKEIALFGIDMASRDEYILQRPGFYFFKHLAVQRGIKVWAPFESDIMQHAPLYGYSDVTPMGRKLAARATELKGRLNELRRQQGEINHSITYLEGALEDLDYVSAIWGGAMPLILPGTGKG